MGILDYLIVFGAGCIAGFINTLAGGGSLLTLPILIFMGLPPAMANGTNRVGIFMQTASAVWGFQSKGVSAFPFAIWLAGTSVVGALIGAKIAVDIEGALFHKVLAIVMIIVLIITLVNPMKKKYGGENLGFRQTVIAAILFFFIGIYGGFIHAGVGFIIMSTLVLINQIDLVKVNSIKVFVVLIYTVVALGVFIYEDQVNWMIGLVLAGGMSIGGWTASRWSVNKGERWVRYFLIVAVSAISIRLWFF